MSPRAQALGSISGVRALAAAKFLWWCIRYDRSIHAFLHLPSRTSPHQQMCIRTRRGRISCINAKLDAEDILPQMYTYQRPRQRRRPSNRPRKPRNYWNDPENLRNELHQFWEGVGSPVREMYPGEPPPLPSERILNYFDRNDLRGAIAQMGGRENVAHVLGGARVVPGRWNDALMLEEVKCLLPLMEGEKRQPHRIETQEERDTDQTIHKEEEMVPLAQLVAENVVTSTDLQTKEFWSKDKAVKELYKYLESYRKQRRRPAVWMPPLAELSREGYPGLFNACSRFRKLPCYSDIGEEEGEEISGGGLCEEEIHQAAGLVPFQEWRFFESQLQLFVELQQYLRRHHNCSEAFFPEPSDVLSNGHTQLYDLIRVHGGKTLLAQKLDMKFAWNADTSESWGWGNFSLAFAVELLQLIRSQYMQVDPPLSFPVISMPSEKDLNGHGDLAAQVRQHGGYENVARRLGLAYFDFDGKKLQMDEVRYRRAKKLWLHRHTAARKMDVATERKRKGIPWDERLVVNELRAYTNANNTKRSLAPIVMPLSRHFDEDDRADLRRAISKFGGKAHFCESAGLIPIEDWQRLDEAAKTELFL